MTLETQVDLKSLIRTIHDYPKPGIAFRDITTLIANPLGLRETIRQLTTPYQPHEIDYVIGIEARGFIFGTAVAHELGAGFVPIRKPGKLPGKTVKQSYELEYGTDTVEIHEDAIPPGSSVLLVDDLIATGGTAEAAVKLVRLVGGKIIGAAFVVNLPDIGGYRRLSAMGLEIHTLMEFEGD